MDKPLLFTPFQLRNVTFSNRAVLSPMQLYRAGPDGKMTDWHIAHLQKFAIGGFGTVITEAVFVTPEARSTWGDCGLWSDAQVEPLQRLTNSLHAMGCVAGIQLHHAGPKSSRRRPWEGMGPLLSEHAEIGEPPWQSVSSSAGRTVDGWNPPCAMTLAEIPTLVEAYVAAARRADRAGFDLLNLHAAHGYLLHSFLSPVANARTDAYGGSLEGRMRLVLEIAAAVRAVWPSDKVMQVRMSCVDWRPDLEGRDDGWTIADSIVLAKRLKAIGVDMVDCSSGGIRAENTAIDFARKRLKYRRGFQVPYAAAIRRDADLPTMAVGIILDGPQAEAILAEGKADLVAVAREALVNPNWPLLAANALMGKEAWSLWPSSYGWWLEMRDRVGIED